MTSSVNILRIVVASPGDVQAERDVLPAVIHELNRGVARDRGLRLELSRWETDSYPGFHPEGPQGLIDRVLRVEDCDILLGIFWKRFGTPTMDARSGTEHEFRAAYAAWQQQGRPQVMVYFNQAPAAPQTVEEIDQWRQALEFRRDFPREGLWWPYNGATEFERLARQHLTQFIRDKWQAASPTSQPEDEPDSPGAAESGGASQSGSGVLATDGAVAAGAHGAAVGGDVGRDVTVVHAESGSTVVFGEPPVAMPAVDVQSVMGRYLAHVISRNRYLQLQGIRSGGKLVNIELEHIYIALKATRTRTLEAEEAWLSEERKLAAGEGQRVQREPGAATVTIKVEEALAEHRRLVALGDPGSGKTTLLRYLALQYARDQAEDSNNVMTRLGLPESGYLPVLLPLRNLGAFLKANYPEDDGTEGHGRLLEFLRAYLRGERLEVPEDFFDADLNDGRVVALLDGMDEVGDFDLRRRVARLIEAFADAYPQCRMVVTSRIVGYTDAARLGGDFAATTIRDFTLTEVEQFLSHWHRLVAIGLMGPGESAENYAAGQTRQLMESVQANPRVRELAINPLMLTVIALVHRDRVKLPERRAELYAEAVDVLLGKWDEARGVEEIQILENAPFDTGDRRLLLQSIALKMHEAGEKEVGVDGLSAQLKAAFAGKTPDPRSAERAAERFLNVIRERTGLLVEAGQGVYRFSHLTFQEYLAAVEVGERDDYLQYTLARAHDAFWREVILLEAGYLSAKSVDKPTRLARAIADAPREPEPFHNLVLAAECIRDAGPTRVEGDLAAELTARLQRELETPIPETGASAPWLTRLWGRVTGGAESRRDLVLRRIAAASALSRVEPGVFGTDLSHYSRPYGEPRWVTVPAGEFWMGSGEGDREAYPDEKPAHRLYLPEFQISRTPITNAQYLLYVQATDAGRPEHWEDGQPPRDKLEHPVVGVSWHEAMAYCRWLSQVTGKRISLPSEAEWEKAARGDADQRLYPWGDEFSEVRCNCLELALRDTTPVGIFLAGASPYGCLDLAGNVWEWTRSLWGESGSSPRYGYPYDPMDGREDLDAGDEVLRVVRGGSFFNNRQNLRCAFRFRYDPNGRSWYDGFRVAALP